MSYKSQSLTKKFNGTLSLPIIAQNANNGNNHNFRYGNQKLKSSNLQQENYPGNSSINLDDDCQMGKNFYKNQNISSSQHLKNQSKFIFNSTNQYGSNYHNSKIQGDNTMNKLIKQKQNQEVLPEYTGFEKQIITMMQNQQKARKLTEIQQFNQKNYPQGFQTQHDKSVKLIISPTLDINILENWKTANKPSDQVIIYLSEIQNLQIDQNIINYVDFIILQTNQNVGSKNTKNIIFAKNQYENFLIETIQEQNQQFQDQKQNLEENSKNSVIQFYRAALICQYHNKYVKQHQI
ncbi:hypothetical protein PPERSA_11852 [Pseudocohnilembus persalinus]|uniref:Uncharacterized protein n=1 Tax=Pseudocohnilembus persalinus TaxID=266149 RepID=A0A0V0QKD6_PSEPJ|nr:hypothetical protein PPERSA_11852 [Pseudocohnilembus persalinus]|eukprot:KRX02512.1 hypothetical protein PPERSA_11852 [Pseudocohnilembus persalinus]